MVEDLEEGELRLLFGDQPLYVIDEEDVYLLVEVDKVVGRIGSCSGDVLHLKHVRGDVEHLELRVKLSDP